jgi:hypothetical protein
MRNISVIIMVLCSLQGCAQKPNIQITKTYIYNEYWNRPVANFFLIERMKPIKDSALNIFSDGFNRNSGNHWNIVNKLELDSSFAFLFISDASSKILNDTIYFDRKNQGQWVFRDPATTLLGRKADKFGELENDSWYKISHLRDRQFYVYIYVDTTGEIHRFDQDLSNY